MYLIYWFYKNYLQISHHLFVDDELPAPNDRPVSELASYSDYRVDNLGQLLSVVL